MKKIIKQDGKRRVFILEDGSEIPFDKKEKKIFKPSAEDTKIINENK